MARSLPSVELAAEGMSRHASETALEASGWVSLPLLS